MKRSEDDDDDNEKKELKQTPSMIQFFIYI